MLRLKEIRKQLGITARQVAEHINVAESTMSLYESGKREPDIGTIVKLAKFFNVSLEYLLGVSDKPSIDEQHVLEVAKYFYNEEKPADEGELSENVVIYHRDGKTVRRTFSKAQLAMISAMLDAIPDENGENTEL